MTMIGDTICRMEIPHARMAVISLSADILPNTSMMETSEAQGIVKASAMGTAYRTKSIALLRGTPSDT